MLDRQPQIVSGPTWHMEYLCFMYSVTGGSILLDYPYPKSPLVLKCATNIHDGHG